MSDPALSGTAEIDSDPSLPLARARRAVPTLRVAIVGHVDHGKSTLVGRLLHETGCLPDGKVDQVAEMCRQRGMPFEWAFVTDALKAERDQGVTIDVSHIRLDTAKRRFVLVDAPGHREFLKNMISGAAGSDAALLVIDAEEGVREQSRRHGYLLHLLGLRRVVVAVNKMDLVGRSAERFTAIEREFRTYLDELGITPDAVIPVSARDGDLIAAPSPAMAWYEGPSVLEALEGLPQPTLPAQRPLRLPVQDVYKFDDRRLIVGRVESGRFRVGDTLLFSPSNKIAKVRSIESWHVDEPQFSAQAGQSVALTLEEQIFVERGEIASHVESAPIESTVFRARLVWLSRKPLEPGARLTLKLATKSVPVRVQEIEKIIDTETLRGADAAVAERDSVVEAVLRTRGLLALDPHTDNPRTGRFVLVDGYDLVGGGIINMDGYPDQRALVTVKSSNLSTVEHKISTDMRAIQSGHRGGVLWFTGLSGAGKSTLAIEVERRLFQKGYQVYVLDGDNVRGGLNANLGFSPEDRAENIRRVGEVSALFADAGVIVLTAFISPYRADRRRARAAAGDGFHEIYIKADLAVCEARDPKGLYRRARAGEIADFTGISAPYEPPDAPDLVVDTATSDIDNSVEAIVAYVADAFEIREREAAVE